jgi:hypothetical protein
MHKDRENNQKSNNQALQEKRKKGGKGWVANELAWYHESPRER